MDLKSIGLSYLHQVTGQDKLPNEDSDEVANFATQIGYQIESQKIKKEAERFQKQMSAFPKVGGGGI